MTTVVRPQPRKLLATVSVPRQSETVPLSTNNSWRTIFERPQVLVKPIELPIRLSRSIVLLVALSVVGNRPPRYRLQVTLHAVTVVTLRSRRVTAPLGNPLSVTVPLWTRASSAPVSLSLFPRPRNWVQLRATPSVQSPLRPQRLLRTTRPHIELTRVHLLPPLNERSKLVSPPPPLPVPRNVSRSRNRKKRTPPTSQLNSPKK